MSSTTHLHGRTVKSPALEGRLTISKMASTWPRALLKIFLQTILHNALDTAVKWGLVPRNVCDLTSPPRKERFEIQPLTAEQVQQFLTAVHGH